MYKLLVYLHLVGWMSQIWYIPTWLGDGCMYESLVIGRSFVMYVVMLFFWTSFCRLLLCSRGAWNQSWELNQPTSAYQRIQHAFRGSMTLCPWCQRGRVTWCGFFHQIQRGRLLALWCMYCTWWKPTCSKTTPLYMVTRWIYRRDIRCDRMHDSSVYRCDEM